jgi:hypothetical protein
MGDRMACIRVVGCGFGGIVKAVSCRSLVVWEAGMLRGAWNEKEDDYDNTLACFYSMQLTLPAS